MKPEELKALAELLGLKQAESVSAAMLAKGATWIAPGNDYVRLDWLTDPRGMLWIRRQLAAQNCLFHASLQRAAGCSSARASTRKRSRPTPSGPWRR
jgi:hypothetical protein